MAHKTANRAAAVAAVRSPLAPRRNRHRSCRQWSGTAAPAATDRAPPSSIRGDQEYRLPDPPRSPGETQPAPRRPEVAAAVHIRFAAPAAVQPGPEVAVREAVVAAARRRRPESPAAAAEAEVAALRRAAHPADAAPFCSHRRRR